MTLGDLVKCKFPERNFVGALTALKFAQRLEARIDNRVGLVIKIAEGGNTLVNFEGEVIVVHAMFLEVISEVR